MATAVPAVPGVLQTSPIGGMLQGSGAVLNQSTNINTAPPTLTPTPKRTTRTSANVSSGGGALATLNSTATDTSALFDEMQRQHQEATQKQLGLLDTQRSGLDTDFLNQLVTNFGYDQAAQMASQFGLSTSGLSNTGNPGMFNTQMLGQQNQATQAKNDIDAYYQQFLGQQNQNKTDTEEAAARGGNQVEDALRRNFASRGALDSTFYAKALSAGIGGVNEAKIRQIGSINQAISSAMQETNMQKQKVDMQLQDITNQLNDRKTQFLTQLQSAYNSGKLSVEQYKQAALADANQFASETEMQKINTLSNIKLNIAQLQSSYSSQQNSLKTQFEQLTGTNDLTPTSVVNAAQNAMYIAQNPVGGRDNLMKSYVSNFIANGLAPDQAQQQAQSIVQAAEQYISTNPNLQNLTAQNSGQ
jgi:hypothetical protein